MKHLILDTETYSLDGPISCAVTYDVGARQFNLYDERDLDALRAACAEADWLTGWNLSTFDLPLLHNKAKNFALPEFAGKTNDLLFRARGANRFEKGWKLGDVARRTIGRDKLGVGSDAPAMARQSEWGKLFTYCLHDVILTLELYQFLARYGYLVGPSGPVSLTALPSPPGGANSRTSPQTSVPQDSGPQGPASQFGSSLSSPSAPPSGLGT